MNSILIAKDLYRTYQDGKHRLCVLKAIDLSLKKGEIMIILGPSGSGKSTLLHILGGLDKPSQGEVFLDGVSIYKADDAALSKIRNKRIGFIFQFYHLLPEFDALENVMMPALITGQAKDNKGMIKEHAENLLDMVGLKNRIYHRPSQLSGGEAQRVAIARALINKPDVVLCDEPTGNLDSENSMAIFELLKNLNTREGQSFIIVTHERAHAKFSDNIKHLVDGKLAAA